MNTSQSPLLARHAAGTRHRDRPWLRTICLACAALVGVGLGSCIDINGGALELAWQFYRRDGISCCPDEDYCGLANIKEVVVHLEPIDKTTGLVAIDRTFPCRMTQATTRFDIAPGRYQVTVEGRCAAEAVAKGPGPIDRDLRRGEVTSLGAVALTVDSIDPCCRGNVARTCP